MSIRFDGRVAIVTGAGNGLGRAHALGLAARGAKVVVNDFAPASAGETAADRVVAEIRAAGGEAMANPADVSDFDQVQAMVAAAMDAWGRVDCLVANAGILRDKTFAKMELADFRKVIDVHLMGTVHCAKAVWEIMRAQNYGRLVFTSSASGLYGNFGQSNYGAAKAAMMGLMNVLHLEGAKSNIRVNTLAPTAATAMTAGLIPEEAMKLLRPDSITPGVLFLLGENAPSRVILGAGAGSFARTLVTETAGIALPEDEWTPEAVAAHFGEISDPAGETVLTDAFQQTDKFVRMAVALRETAVAG